MDVSNPEFPGPRGGFLDVPAHDVFIVDDYVFVSIALFEEDYVLYLQIFDISDADHPLEISHTEIGEGRFPDIDDADGLYVSGEFVYMTAGQGGLHIISIADVENPQLISTFDTPGSANHVCVRDNIAYVADWEDGMRIIGVSDPENPVELSDFETADPAVFVEVKDDFAYITEFLFFDDDWRGCVRVVDISDPRNPFEVAMLEIVGQDLKIQGDRLYGGGRIFDISNPENPEIIGSFMGGGYIFDVAGDLVYTTGEARFSAINVEDPEDPMRLGFYHLWHLDDAAIDGEYIFVGSSSNILHAYNISDPTRPRLTGSLDLRSDCVAMGNDNLVVASFREAYIVDVTDPENLEILGECRIGGYARDIDTKDEYAYIAVDAIGLVIVDITDPEHPEVVGEYECGSAYRVEVSGDYAFVYPNRNPIIILDVSDPSNPVRITTLDINSTNGIFLSDTLAFIIHSDELYIFNISDINNPELISRPELGYYAHEIYCDGNLAYLTGRFDINQSIDDLHVLDFSNPEELVEVGYYDTPSWGCRELIVHDGLAYLVKYGCVGIYRFTDPAKADNSFILHPSSFILHPAYPDPFNSTTTIRYSLPFPAHVSMGVYDQLGRKVGMLFDGFRQVGFYDVSLNAGNLQSGLYFVRLEATGEVLSRKVMLIK